MAARELNPVGFLYLYFQHSNFHGKLCHDSAVYFCFQLLRLKKTAPLLGLDNIFAQRNSRTIVHASQVIDQRKALDILVAQNLAPLLCC